MDTTKLAGWILILAGALLPLLAVAGTGGGLDGSEFEEVYSLLQGWMTGFLGKVIAISFILVGLVAGVMRQSIMGFVVGVAAGVGMLVAPGIIDNMFGATVPLVAAVP